MSAIRFGVTLALALALAVGGYWAGDHNRNNAWLAKQAAQAQLAGEALLAEALRGQAAAAESARSQQALQTSYSTLEDKFNAFIRRGPILDFRSGNGDSGTCSDRVDAVGGSEPDQATDVPNSNSASLDLGLDISRGAVWVWNSALTGQDSPAGACGAADTSSKACAVGAGISLEATWANHIANAKSCAQDRLRHQQLIDYIKGTPE